MELGLLSDPGDDVARLGCQGTITQSGFSPETPDPIEEALGTEAYTRKVLLDLNKATFIDSSGVSWLISRHNSFNENGGLLVIHSVPPVVQGVLDLLRLGSIFNLAQDETAAEAIAAGEPV